jgi:tetratricopeptide (TPR) repeat protein
MKRTILLVLAVFGATLFGGAAADAQTTFSKDGAMAIMQTRDWNRLLAYGQAWARTQPNNPDAWFVVGRAYGSSAFHIGLGRPLDAVAAYERAVQLQSQYIDGWVALGMTDEELNRWAAASVAFQHCVQINPDNTHYWDQLAISYGHAQQFAEELRAIAGLESHAKTVQDWNMAGTDLSAMAPLYQTAIVLERAKADLRRGLQLDPRNGNIVNNIGTVEELQGNWQAALDNFQRAASLNNPLGRTNYNALQSELAAARAAASQQSADNKCIPCIAHLGQAHQYIVNHPGTSIGEALAATSH